MSSLFVSSCVFSGLYEGNVAERHCRVPRRGKFKNRIFAFVAKFAQPTKSFTGKLNVSFQRIPCPFRALLSVCGSKSNKKLSQSTRFLSQFPSCHTFISESLNCQTGQPLCRFFSTTFGREQSKARICFDVFLSLARPTRVLNERQWRIDKLDSNPCLTFASVRPAEREKGRKNLSGMTFPETFVTVFAVNKVGVGFCHDTTQSTRRHRRQRSFDPNFELFLLGRAGRSFMEPRRCFSISPFLYETRLSYSAESDTFAWYMTMKSNDLLRSRGSKSVKSETFFMMLLHLFRPPDSLKSFHP